MHGKLQRQGLVVHVIAERLEDLTADLSLLSTADFAGISSLARADEAKHNPYERHAGRNERNQRRSPGVIAIKSRDFR